MTFDVTADAYSRFMGRFSEPLATEFLRAADIPAAQRVLDVGSGPGQLTALLVDRLGAEGVSAVDPSPPFVDAVRARFPGVDARVAAAEDLPYEDATFEAALAQLVVHFMTDPVAGLAEMARVTRPGGVVAACVWDHAKNGQGPLSVFWRAAEESDSEVPDESQRPGVREGDLPALASSAGLSDIEASTLSVRVPVASFEDWWEPFTLGVGPAGAYVGRLTPSSRDQLRERCAELLPAGPFEVSAKAWCVVARA